MLAFYPKSLSLTHSLMLALFLKHSEEEVGMEYQGSTK